MHLVEEKKGIAEDTALCLMVTITIMVIMEGMAETETTEGEHKTTSLQQNIPPQDTVHPHQD